MRGGARVLSVRFPAHLPLLICQAVGGRAAPLLPLAATSSTGPAETNRSYVYGRMAGVSIGSPPARQARNSSRLTISRASPG